MGWWRGLGGLLRFGTEIELGVQGAGFGTVLGPEEQRGDRAAVGCRRGSEGPPLEGKGGPGEGTGVGRCQVRVSPGEVTRQGVAGAGSGACPGKGGGCCAGSVG